MTTQELIKLLSLFPPDTKVLGGDYSGEEDLTTDNISVLSVDSDGGQSALVFSGGNSTEWGLGYSQTGMTLTDWLKDNQSK